MRPWKQIAWTVYAAAFALAGPVCAWFEPPALFWLLWGYALAISVVLAADRLDG